MSLEEYQARTNKFMDEIAATSVLPDILAYVRECTTCSVLPKVTGDMSGDVMPPQVRFHPSVQQVCRPLTVGESLKGKHDDEFAFWRSSLYRFMRSKR